MLTGVICTGHVIKLTIEILFATSILLPTSLGVAQYGPRKDERLANGRIMFHWTDILLPLLRRAASVPNTG